MERGPVLFGLLNNLEGKRNRSQGRGATILLQPPRRRSGDFAGVLLCLKTTFSTFWQAKNSCKTLPTSCLVNCSHNRGWRQSFVVIKRLSFPFYFRLSLRRNSELVAQQTDIFPPFLSLGRSREDTGSCSSTRALPREIFSSRSRLRSHVLDERRCGYYMFVPDRQLAGFLGWVNTSSAPDFQERKEGRGLSERGFELKTKTTQLCVSWSAHELT